MKPRSGSRRKPAYPDPKQWQHPAPEGHQAILNAVNTALTPRRFPTKGLRPAQRQAGPRGNHRPGDTPPSHGGRDLGGHGASRRQVDGDPLLLHPRAATDPGPGRRPRREYPVPGCAGRPTAPPALRHRGHPGQAGHPGPVTGDGHRNYRESQHRSPQPPRCGRTPSNGSSS